MSDGKRRSVERSADYVGGGWHGRSGFELKARDSWAMRNTLYALCKLRKIVL